MRINLLVSDVKVKTSFGHSSRQPFSRATVPAKFAPMKRRTLDITVEPGHGDLTGTIKNSTAIR